MYFHLVGLGRLIKCALVLRSHTHWLSVARGDSRLLVLRLLLLIHRGADHVLGCLVHSIVSLLEARSLSSCLGSIVLHMGSARAIFDTVADVAAFVRSVLRV